MDITKYIRELIILNECVILRGFGGFDTEYRHATVDRKKRKITPPSKTITFRKEWTQDNGTLEKHIVQSLHIKPEKASEYIDQFVEGLFKKLNSEGTVILEGIGKFMVNDKGTISFSELEDENYLADSFGLDTLELDSGVTEKPESVEIVLNPNPTGKRKLTGWYVSAGILLLFILITTLILLSGKGGIPLIQGIDSGESVADSSEIVVFGQQSEILEDSVVKAIEQTLNKRTAVKEALSINNTNQVNKVGTKTYYLVAGSFKSRSNAEILKNKLQQKGFKPEVLETGSSYTRVVIGAFNNKDQASKNYGVYAGNLNNRFG